MSQPAGRSVRKNYSQVFGALWEYQTERLVDMCPTSLRQWRQRSGASPCTPAGCALDCWRLRFQVHYKSNPSTGVSSEGNCMKGHTLSSNWLNPSHWSDLKSQGQIFLSEANDQALPIGVNFESTDSTQEPTRSQNESTLSQI